jgi:methylthioribose-1-phosphate isomerase
MPIAAVRWAGDAVEYVDQRALPQRIERRRAESIDDVVDAIQTLAVRGAPCIGVFGAYGIALAHRLHGSGEAFIEAARRIREARPTAVNLAWAVDRMLRAPAEGYLSEAAAIHDEQLEVDRAIARHGFALMPNEGGVITHCNTGALATAGEGTALGVIINAHDAGKRVHVYADETRPLLQGARLTTVECKVAGVPVTLIPDGAAAATIRAKGVKCAIVGADRIAANGDSANKIGTYGLAIACAHHGIPFYIAAPRSTIDFGLASGEGIPIEERRADEVRGFGSAQTAPPDVQVYNPAFDVTPAALIAGIVTEYGVLRAPYEASIAPLEGLAPLVQAAP